MNPFESAAETLGPEVVERIREQARRDLREHPPTPAQVTAIARLLLLLCASADRNRAAEAASLDGST